MSRLEGRILLADKTSGDYIPNCIFLLCSDTSTWWVDKGHLFFFKARPHVAQANPQNSYVVVVNF